MTIRAKHTVPVIIGLGLCALSANAQTVLFQDTFSGGAPTGWSSAFAPTSGTAEFIQDTENVFGYGASHYFLRAFEAQNLNTSANFTSPSEIVTLSYEFIGRPTANDTRWFNIEIRDGGSRAHVISHRLTDATIRDINVSYGGNQTLLRFDVIMNNSESTLNYTVNGTDFDLASGNASVWVNGSQVAGAEEYVFARNMGTGPVNNIRLLADSTTRATFDIANITVFEGAVVGAPIPEPSTYALLFGLGALGVALIIRRRRRS